MLFNHHHDWMPPTYWTVQLSDNTYIVQDELPGEESCWLRLKKHCEENNLYIISIICQFRTNIIEIPKGKEAYYFSKAASCFIGQPTDQQYVFGYVEDEKVFLDYYKIPELIITDSFVRSIDECRGKLILGKRENA